jgi:Zn-dependent protease
MPNNEIISAASTTSTFTGLESPAPVVSAKKRWRARVAKILAPLAAVFKFLAVIAKLKYALLIGSMLVSVAAYTWLWGWTFAVGFVLLLGIHESGHVIELKRQGVAASLPAFIPFLGAAVMIKERPASAYNEAKVGLAGPLAGTLASMAVYVQALSSHSSFWLALAYVGFFINAFNLVPALPFDGGRILGVVSPKIWVLGLVVLGVMAVIWTSPLLLLMLLIGVLELSRRWKTRHTEGSKTYHSATHRQRLGIGLTYAALLAVTLGGSLITYRPNTHF